MVSRQNLAIVITSLGAGGAERVATMQASFFARCGIHVTLITLEGESKDHYVLSNPKITRRRFSKDDPKVLHAFIEYHNFNLTIDHIHWNEGHYEFFELMAATNLRLVVFDHSTYFYPLYHPWRWAMFKKRAEAYKKADAISTLTRHTCQLFRQKNPRTVFIPNALSYESDSVSSVLKSNAIISVGNWRRDEKRLDRVLEIFSEVSRIMPRSRLILVGPYNQENMVNLLDRYQSPVDRIDLGGEQRDVERYYLRARVCLQTSDIEGFGLVLTEAGMHGLPRVAADCPGLDEIIDHGVDGYLFDQLQTGSAVEYLVTLLSDDELCQRMSVKALYSTRKFTLENIGKRWIWLYKAVTTSPDKETLEKVINEDCKTQNVDLVSISKITEDYDAQLLRLTNLLNKDASINTIDTNSPHSVKGNQVKRLFQSPTAQLFSNLSQYLESRVAVRVINKSGFFNKEWYKQQYPDVANSKIDPALHYVLHGAQEGRDPSNKFSTLSYLNNNNALLLSKENPLIHYLRSTGNKHMTAKPKPRFFRKAPNPIQHTLLAKDQAWLNLFTTKPRCLTLLEPNYVGIRQSASQFVPEEQMLFLKDDLDELATDYYATLIDEANPEKILIQGFPPSYLNLVELLRKRRPKTPIYCIYHGSFTQQRHAGERACLQHLIELHKDGFLRRIGFVKEGMAETLQSIGVDARFIMNFIAKIPQGPSSVDGTKLGIIGSEWNERKPLYQQIAAAKHFHTDVIRIIGSESSTVDFCRLFEVGAIHLGTIPQKQIPGFLSKNTLNMYVTLSECAPMLPIESLSEGAPCLFGPNNHYFSDHQYLRNRLVVDTPDSETCIARYAKVAIEEREKIISEYITHAGQYNPRAIKSFELFMED